MSRCPQIVNLGKQAFNEYQQSQGGNNQQHNNQGNNNQQQGFDLGGSHLNNQPPQGGNQDGFDLGDIQQLVSHAQNHSDGQSQDAGLFGQVAGFLKNQQQNGNINPNDVDEDQVMQNHQKVTNSNETADSNEIGNAAALNAIKSVLGGSGGGSGGGNMQQQIIGAAMAAAGNLFDQKQSQGQANGVKEEAMQKAGEMAMKLMIKNQMSGLVGGGNSGGLGALASKFL
ncbi:hypothetical protein OC861_003675 [Tilletia horrida]|nr:hypothetical protein OC845_003473 [Tilletia horrida]KAK0565581.1 hypothetical protein OC861_003675 [Tilletia horrida]